MSEDIGGGNKTGALRAGIERIVGLEVEKKAVADERKELVKGLNEQGHPISLMLGYDKRQALDDDQIAKHKIAGAVTGKPIFIDGIEVTPEEADITQEDAEVLLESLRDVQALDVSKGEFKDAIKEQYGELKGLGFAPKAVKEMVRRRLKPKTKEKLTKFEELIETYEAAIA